MTDIADLHVAFIGNFEPEFSTENEYLDAYRRRGIRVSTFQGDQTTAMMDLIAMIEHDPPDYIHWTRTRQHSQQVGHAVLWEILRMAGRRSVPVVGVHLDIWWGLQREEEVFTAPYFRGVDLLLTADGGNQDRWESIGVNHRWLLPAISERWLGIGTPQQKYRSKIAFVGSWQGGYHPEAEHRHQLVRWLQDTYGDDVRFYPQQGHPAIRGRELNDLYASVDVVVGDSAVLPGKSHYCSDRIPETLGRGGYLLHPGVEGINLAEGDPFWRAKRPLCDHWEAGDWDELRTRIDDELTTLQWSGDVGERQFRVDEIAAAHTYTYRVAEIIDIMRLEGLL